MINKKIVEKIKEIKFASRELALVSVQTRTAALQLMANTLRVNTEKILRANEKDISFAHKMELEQKRINILTITEKDIENMADFFLKISLEKDLVGTLIERDFQGGLCREKKLQPLGVIGVIYEARPSVVTDCAALCMRTGNALLLRGSSHSVNTDRTIVYYLQEAISKAGIPKNVVDIVSEPGYEVTLDLVKEDRYIDMLIARGGYKMLSQIKQAATVPVVGAGPGNCHIYIDKSAKYEMAEAIVLNSKVPRPLACNASETILIHKDWDSRFIISLMNCLKKYSVTIHGCDRICKLWTEAISVTEKDWEEEYFAPHLAVKIVDSLEEAVEHINQYRTPHTESIITETENNAKYFLNHVEANVVCCNASTRLTDGIGFGLGGEIGISTQKYPIGGPIGMCHLMQEKYYLMGNGTLR